MRRVSKTFCLMWIVFAFALVIVPICEGQELDTEMLSKDPIKAKTPEVEALPPAAPVPAQIITGRKVFVSNLGGDSELIDPDHYSGGPDRTYNQFYAALKSWGRYELVTAPADSDLIFEIHLTAPVGPAQVNRGDGGSGRDPQFRLAIVDPKTRVVLWAFTEHLNAPHATHDQNFDQAMTKIVDDMKKLTVPPATAADAGAK